MVVTGAVWMRTQGTPLQKREQREIRAQPGAKDWEAAAARFEAPPSHAWDVFISHAGNSADKPFARALARLLERTGWGLRVFLDDDSLVPGGSPGQVQYPILGFFFW